MKILVIQGHPDAKSFSHGNAMNYVEHAKSLGHEVALVDLSDADFDPVLRYGYRQHMEDESFPKLVQQLVKNADHIAFFFPIWWSAEPSILKGLFDRVFTPKFAYIYHPDGKREKLLTGKTASVFTTSHGPAFFYKMFGNVLFRWKYLLLAYCGIKATHCFDLGNMEDKVDTPERRQKYIEKCANTLK
ncbi:NAD(P)H-dependent oxidoreductase [Apilactobacillus kunkeei]|uniref:NADPH-quinone reductase n=1 Tax=Apilactobacillus kunkeei TaxID=148814 RepID=A0A1L8CGX6_9LACO|nr:NAD(P)H-dependent oxidoreductase [Apilactobacillus kunkeei]GAT90428.1 NADPH-quinone reductase [Apilactobacillus kunkeei]